MQKIAPCLWFDGKAEEATNFYMAIFKDARVTSVMRYGDAGPGPKGSVLATTFHLERQVHSLERRSNVHVYPRHLAFRALRDAGGNR